MALVGFVEGDDGWVVEIGGTDVAAWLATVKVRGGGCNLGELVGRTTSGLDAGSESGKGQVGRGDAVVVGWARVVLDFLEEEKIRGLEVGDDVAGNQGQVFRRRRQIFDVVAADSDGLALALALEAGGLLSSNTLGGLAHLDGGEGEDRVETKGMLHDTGDFLEFITHLAGVGVLGAIKRGANDDSLWVGIYGLTC